MYCSCLFRSCQLHSQSQTCVHGASFTIRRIQNVHRKERSRFGLSDRETPFVWVRLVPLNEWWASIHCRNAWSPLTQQHRPCKFGWQHCLSNPHLWYIYIEEWIVMCVLAIHSKAANIQLQFDFSFRAKCMWRCLQHSRCTQWLLFGWWAVIWIVFLLSIFLVTRPSMTPIRFVYKIALAPGRIAWTSAKTWPDGQAKVKKKQIV